MKTFIYLFFIYLDVFYNHLIQYYLLDKSQRSELLKREDMH